MYREKEKKKHNVHLVLSIFLLILVIAAFGAAYVISITGSLNHEELDKDNLGAISMPALDENDKSVVNVALFGVDQRNDQKQVRSDAIMILSVDRKHNKIKLTSVMRDLLVDIDGHAQNKINSAYFYGGPQLAVKTLNQTLAMDIKEYATVNFQQMATIIDAVGGIEIDISEAEMKDANNSIYEQSAIAGLPQDIIKKSGLQTLSGTQAVAYARIRHVKNAQGNNDDFGRTDRQREVLSKLFDKALSMNPIGYPEFARKLLPAVTTSLDIGEIMSHATAMLKKPSMEELRLPLQSQFIGNGVAYVGDQQCLNADVGAMSQTLFDFIYNDVLPE